MHKLLSLISRITLVLGVMVALTPCNACQQGGVAQGMMHCPMALKAKGMNCCQSKKSPSPICKVMNQSSTAAVSHGLDLGATSVVGFVLPLTVSPSRVVFAAVFPADTSPCRAPLSLRI